MKKNPLLNKGEQTKMDSPPPPLFISIYFFRPVAAHLTSWKTPAGLLMYSRRPGPGLHTHPQILFRTQPGGIIFYSRDRERRK